MAAYSIMLQFISSELPYKNQHTDVHFKEILHSVLLFQQRILGRKQMKQVHNIQKMELIKNATGKYFIVLNPMKNLNGTLKSI